MTRPEREIITVGLMIGLYCRRHHGEKELCGDCRELAAYAEARIREVMRFAGPKMIYRHPLLAIRHLFGR